MARTIGKLTAIAVSRAKKRGYLADGGGLYLQVSPTGAKSWVFRFREGGKLREAGLGATHTFTLAEAREKALEFRKLRHERIDPIEARKAERSKKLLDAAMAMTFEQCAKAYVAAHEAGWRSAKHRTQWPSSLAAYVCPIFGDLPVAAVDVGLVMKVLEPIWSAKPETASRVRGRIEAILDWATARGFRAGENPARWRGHLENLLPKKSTTKRALRAAKGHDEHYAALPYREIGAFMIALREQPGKAARALEFTILAAARTGEVFGATWDEIDLGEHVWTIPANRMKAHRPHRVPLSEAAIAALGPVGEGRVFGPLNHMSMLKVIERLGFGVTAHGFRSTFSDWCAEQTNFPAEVREMALAHAVGDKVEASYRRGDLFEKRRQLAETWAAYCAAPPTGRNVVPMRQPAATATAG